MEKHRSRIAGVLYAFALVMVSSIVGAFADKVYADVGCERVQTAALAHDILEPARGFGLSTVAVACLRSRPWLAPV